MDAFRPSGKVVTPPNPSGTLILSPDDESFIEPTDVSGSIVAVSSGLPVTFKSGGGAGVCASAVARAGPDRVSAI